MTDDDHGPDYVIDEDREARLGFPEIVFGEGKPAGLIAELIDRYARDRRNLLITRLAEDKLPARKEAWSYDSVARTLTLIFTKGNERLGRVAVVSAGSSDRPVVAETLRTLEFLGIDPITIQDVGVAGIHRLTERLHLLEKARVVVVVAGFEGTLASVVAGLVRQPVIGVPTSVGYGVAEGGRAALSAMLASCAAGLTVMNIDNGCGAAVAAYRILGLRAGGQAHGV